MQSTLDEVEFYLPLLGRQAADRHKLRGQKKP